MARHGGNERIREHLLCHPDADFEVSALWWAASSATPGDILRVEDRRWGFDRATCGCQSPVIRMGCVEQHAGVGVHREIEQHAGVSVHDADCTGHPCGGFVPIGVSGAA
jgi:hypothetical protein